jgi:type III secretion system low calcium response chaperone LcrH/SycD
MLGGKMISFETFLINQESIDRLNNEVVLMQHIEEGKSLQELFGFSNEAMVEFYGAARNILEQKRFPEAVKAFSFLAMLNPNISDFWTGLGIAQQNNQDIESALFSYSMAYTIEGENITPYMLAAQCFVDLKDFEQAINVLEIAEGFANEHPEIEKCQQLKQDAGEAIKNIKSKKR